MRKARSHAPFRWKCGRHTPANGTFMIRFLTWLVLLGSVLLFPAAAAAAKKTPTQAPLAAPVTEAGSEAPNAAPAERAAAKSHGRVTGTYSTLRSLGGEDDVIGLEVIIVRSPEGLRAFVQTADGVLATPVVVPVNADGATVSFTIPAATGEPLEFKGKATRQGLTGTLDGRPMTLPRRRSYWQ